MPVFVDTNVFVYRFDDSEPDKQSRCDAWLRHLWEEMSGRVSWQVLQELYVTVTRKLDHPMDSADARSVIRALFSWDPIAVDRPVIEGAWTLQERYSISWWDSLIVAAAQAGGCSAVLTEDLSHGQKFGGVTIVSPFQAEPGPVSGD